MPHEVCTGVFKKYVVYVFEGLFEYELYCVLVEDILP